MIGTKVRVRLDERWLAAQINKRSDVSLNRAAFLVRGVTQRSLKAPAAGREKATGKFTKGEGASEPGEPPFTHRPRRRLRKAILYKTDKVTHTAVIGPVKHIVGKAGAAHEHGGVFKKETFPARPFMAPALRKVRPFLGRFWMGIVR